MNLSDSLFDCLNEHLTRTTISGTIVDTWTGLKSMSVEAGLDRLLTVQEVCELLKVKKSYVY